MNRTKGRSMVVGGVVRTLGELVEALKIAQHCANNVADAAEKSPEAQQEAAQHEQMVWREVLGTFRERTAVQDVRALCNERYGAELRLGSVLKLRGEYIATTGKTVEEADAAPLVDVVAKLRRPATTSKSADGADTRADTAKKNRQQLPDSVDACDLARLLERELPKGGKSQAQIAREFTSGNEAKAQSLLRIIRRFPLLADAVKAAADRAAQ